MSTRLLCIALIAGFCLCSCLAERPTTHWIVNNDTNADLPLHLSVYQPGSARSTTQSQIVHPGIQELKPQSFARGTYVVTASTTDGTVSNTKKMHFESGNWVIVSFTRGDSLTIQRRYGYIDTSFLKSLNGKFSGFDMYTESRMPPVIYSVAKKESHK